MDLLPASDTLKPGPRVFPMLLVGFLDGKASHHREVVRRMDLVRNNLPVRQSWNRCNLQNLHMTGEKLHHINSALASLRDRSRASVDVSGTPKKLVDSSVSLDLPDRSGYTADFTQVSCIEITGENDRAVSSLVKARKFSEAGHNLRNLPHPYSSLSLVVRVLGKVRGNHDQRFTIGPASPLQEYHQTTSVALLLTPGIAAVHHIKALAG
mmetsp:Transcript_73596/g.129897  ORF Transcript_73596/g.129897 Transcript_73596/m.129897 type:complete len:210 (-) Transcript_73596:85-714(-)